MSTIKVLNMAGAEVGTVELCDSIFGIEPNQAVVHEVVKNHLANCRQGTQSALTRAEVSGGGIKPWRQKGTGRARQGSIRSPQWAGGGTVFGPHPRSYAFRVNNKEVKLAMRSALSAKVADGQFTVVDVLLHLFCSFQSSFFVHGDKAIQNLILFFYLSQGCFHSVHGCHFSGLDLLSNFRCCHFTKFHSLSPPTLRSSVPYTYRP